MSNLLTRSITGGAFVLILTLAVYWSGWSFFILLLLIHTAAMLEFFSLFRDISAPQKYFSLLLGTFYLTESFLFNTLDLPHLWIPLSLSLLFLVPVAGFFQKQPLFLRSAASLSGFILITLPLCLLIFLAFSNYIYRWEIVMGLLLLTWANDTFAYLTGFKLGKHKLARNISPKKSWEGAAGGILASLLASFGVAKIFPVFSVFDWLMISLIISIAGNFGDLTESVLKRNAGAKDSGNLLPGHGGVLDRFDAFLFAIPFVFAYVCLKHGC